MKNHILKILIFIFAINLSYSQAWMTSLDIAQNLALAQNKMVLMVWEETTMYPYPILVNDNTGRTLIVNDLFTDETLSPLIWEHFIPVIVKENKYEDLYAKVKGKRRQRYMDKFNDDSIKIMDANGFIINVSGSSDEFQNITEIIEKYALSTEFISTELNNYKEDKTFYSAFFLASKYMDFSIYSRNKTRKALMDMANIYLYEAKNILSVSKDKDKPKLEQRLELLSMQEYLILDRPKKVLRQLKRMEKDGIDSSNRSFAAFLYFTVSKLLNNEDDMKQWKSEVSSLNLKKAQLIYNINS